jgi:hypothetical protein
VVSEMAGTSTRIDGKYYAVIIPSPIDGMQPPHIDFAPRPEVEIPDDYSTLQSDIERTLTVLVVLFGSRTSIWAFPDRKRRREQKFKEYYNKLASIALTALGQDQVRLGRLALSGLQSEVVAREAGHVKNAYIRRLGAYAFLLGVPTVAFYFLCRHSEHWTILYRFREFISMLAGSLLGAWLSFSIRRVTLSFWDLSSLEEDLLDPGIRLLFVGGLTTAVGLLLSTKAVVISIGLFNTNFLNVGTFAVLIGILCGVGEKGLSTTIARRASDFVSSIGGGRATTTPLGSGGSVAQTGPQGTASDAAHGSPSVAAISDGGPPQPSQSRPIGDS